MDENVTREHVEEHAAAVERGDMDAVVADFAENLRPQVPEIAKALPQPVTSAQVLGVQIGDDESVAMIR
jgi:sirohydrochlorin ferrochelatase